MIASSEPNSQNEAPQEDDAWSMMGVYAEGGAVYLGSGWFLTAGQLGTEGEVVSFQGEDLEIDSESWASVYYALELPVDVHLFRVVDPGVLPVEGAVVLDRELELNDPLLLIGPGRDVKGEAVVVDGEQRFYQGESSQLKWGTSLVSRFEEEHDGKGFRSSTFDTSLAHGQAQALEGDIGGGVFVEDEVTGQTFLAGIIIASSLRKDPLGTYAYKAPSVDMEQSSWTRSVNLFAYRNQIEEIVSPPNRNVWLWVTVFVGFLLGLLFLGRWKRA